MGYSQLGPTVMFEDNQACIYMSKRSGQINRAKHIDLRVHKLRELVADKCVVLRKVGTLDQVADLFTKSLSATLFEKHRSAFMSSQM